MAKFLEIQHANNMGKNNTYPLGDKLHTRKRAVKGADIDADKVAAAPTNTKLTQIRDVPKYVLQNKANANPRKAPATMLGAKTPPSPPAPKVKDDASGLKKISKNKNINEQL